MGFFPLKVGDGQFRAFSRHLQRGGAADPLSTARDYSDLIFEPHGITTPPLT